MTEVALCLFVELSNVAPRMAPEYTKICQFLDLDIDSTRIQVHALGRTSTPFLSVKSCQFETQKLKLKLWGGEYPLSKPYPYDAYILLRLPQNPNARFAPVVDRSVHVIS